MTTRTREKRVTFLRPFVLEALQGVQPSGTYSVETRDELNRFLPFLKANRTSTWIRICRDPGLAGFLQFVNIDPLDLAAAESRDSMPDKDFEGTLSRTVQTKTPQDSGRALVGGPDSAAERNG